MFYIMLDKEPYADLCICHGGELNYSYTFVLPENLRTRNELRFTSNQVLGMLQSKFAKEQHLTVKKIQNDLVRVNPKNKPALH